MRPRPRTFRIGTRGSALALAQAGQVRSALARKFKNVRFELAVVRTTGDEFQSVELFKRTNIGVFTKAIEAKLRSRAIDIAVHSLKDLPTGSPKGLVLAAVPKRLDTRDVLITRNAVALSGLPRGASIGTGSPRRKRQLAGIRPDLRLVDIRGNLDTRIRRVTAKKDLDGVVLARAGLMRLKKYLKYARPISAELLMPAVGQAALGLQVRRSDKEAYRAVRTLNHAASEKEVLAERAFLMALGGGCRVPVGVRTRIRKNRLSMSAAVFSADGAGSVRGRFVGPLAQAERLSRQLAGRLLKSGAERFLSQARGL